MLIALLAALFLGQPGDGTIAWKVQTRQTSMCCCDGRGYSVGRNEMPETTEIHVIATLRDGVVEDLEIRDAACALKNARLIEGVTADASLDALRAQLERDEADHDKLVLAIALHDHPRVTSELLSLARRHSSSEVRKSATFWLGQQAGEKAAGDLRAIVDEDPEDEVRERAVFAISQLPRERSVPMLIDLVRNHRRPGVRKRAMFWLTQTGDPRALDLIAEILQVK